MSKKDLLQTGIVAIVLALVVFILRMNVYTPISVIGNSMEPTLLNKQRLIALKSEKVERFDIIAFTAPDDAKKSYVKRVIGMPGDVIHYMDDVLYLNGVAYKEPYLEEYKAEKAGGELFTGDFNLDQLQHVQKVPDGKVFVLGDNRSISHDSRAFGFVDLKEITGVIRFCYWPLDQIGPISNHVEEAQ